MIFILLPLPAFTKAACLSGCMQIENKVNDSLLTFCGMKVYNLQKCQNLCKFWHFGYRLFFACEVGGKGWEGPEALNLEELTDSVSGTCLKTIGKKEIITNNNNGNLKCTFSSSKHFTMWNKLKKKWHSYRKSQWHNDTLKSTPIIKNTLKCMHTHTEQNYGQNKTKANYS